MTPPRRHATMTLIVAIGASTCARSPTDPTPPADPATPPTSASISTSAPLALSASASPSLDPTAASPAAPWATRLPPLLFRDINTLADVTLRLYRPDGTLDDPAATELERVLWSSKDDAPPRVSRRLLQLVVKAAAHFDAHEIQVISSHRPKSRPGSRHRSGEAIDFLFPNVPPKKLAEHLRTYARVGVGLYIHPRSQYVHLDVRDASYHWLDSSPPGRTWKEHPLPDITAATRDAAHTPEHDLPL